MLEEELKLELDVNHDVDDMGRGQHFLLLFVAKMSWRQRQHSP